MAHQVCQKRNIIEFLQKIFGKAVAEGMGIDGAGIDPVPHGKLFELDCNSTG